MLSGQEDPFSSPDRSFIQCSINNSTGASGPDTAV